MQQFIGNGEVRTATYGYGRLWHSPFPNVGYKWVAVLLDLNFSAQKSVPSVANANSSGKRWRKLSTTKGI